MTAPTADTITVTFDRTSYAHGDTIRMTLTANLTDPPSTTKVIGGYATIGDGADARRISFTGSFTIDDPTPTVDAWTITDPGGYTWRRIATDPNAAIFETTAE